MYCKHCGKEIQDGSTFCVHCGQQVTAETMRSCPNCGAHISSSTLICPSCGYQMPPVQNVVYKQKSKVLAGILGIVFGSIGVHNFYLGYTSKGVIQLAMTLGGFLTCGISSAAAGIWGLVEGILILTGSIDVDADGNRLSD